MEITIYHNPRCGTSRNTLAAIREAGHEPEVVEYLANPPTREQLARLIADAGLQPRDAVRRKEALYAELGLDRPEVLDAALLDAMAAHPILIERPSWSRRKACACAGRSSGCAKSCKRQDAAMGPL